MTFDVGYSNTSPKMVAEELGLSTGNITYYFPTKEHLLSVIVEMLCDFQAAIEVPDGAKLKITSNAGDDSTSGADAGGNYSIKYVPAKLSVVADTAVDAALADPSPKFPVTGDNSDLWLWFAVAFICVDVIVFDRKRKIAKNS